MTNTAAIATKLNVLESAIVRIEEWASVMFVIVKGLGARFVSKKVVEVEMAATAKRVSSGVKLTAIDGKTTFMVDEIRWKYESKEIPFCIAYGLTESQIAQMNQLLSDLMSQDAPEMVDNSESSESYDLEYDMYNSKGRYYG